MTEKGVKEDATLYLEHGKPMVFGKNHDKGIRMRGTEMEVVELGKGLAAEDCLVWDETLENPATAFLVAQLLPPRFPTPIGVLRSVDEATYESRVVGQIEAAMEAKGPGKLEDLLYSGDLWTVHADHTIS